MEGKTMAEQANLWAKRFIIAAIIQGAIIVGLTAVLVLGQATFMKPEVSRVIAAGGAGTWFTFGYIIYITVGVIAVAVSAIFYHFLGGSDVGSKIPKSLAWSHLVLMNTGVSAASGLMMYAGYFGGAAALPETVGGKGFDPAQVHALMAPFVEPIAIAILVLIAGILAGGMGFLLSYSRFSVSRIK
ncbi:hypothetical protein [Nitrososphaera sp.]|uniref:hypothetical protein n=1 Tax=Nitrososphaera sp. TaxID=1971748 RepID=UPI00307EE125